MWSDFAERDRPEGRGSPTRNKGAYRRVLHSKIRRRRSPIQLAGTAVRWAATAVHLRFRRISVAVKSILGAIGLPWSDPLWADEPINTAEFPYLYTSVSNSVIDS